jgi:hypothetical protein
MRAFSRKYFSCAIVGFVSIAIFPCAAHGAQTAPIPDLSGQWGRDMLFFEPPSSGPGPVMNIWRKPDRSRDTQAPCCSLERFVAEGVWGGDHTNPILKPEAAEAVKTFRELAETGKVVADLHNSCWPEPPPFAMALNFGVNILQQEGEVTIIYLLHNTIRRIRLATRHSENVGPSWQGESVGWYEGDSLVVDTIGIKVAPFSTVDPFGTPHSEALHVVERYRLIDGEVAAETQRLNGAVYRSNPPYGRGTIDPDTTKKGLQVEFTVEDENVFTTSWSGQVTYRRLIGDWPEAVCAENPYFVGGTAVIPTADRPDF